VLLLFDDRKNLRHSPISLEESLSTKNRWVRIFLFVLALAGLVGEYNACTCIFVDVDPVEPIGIPLQTHTKAHSLLIFDHYRWEDQQKERFGAVRIDLWGGNDGTMCHELDRSQV
jgi:hypothetical protein